jgi:NADH dehydrogenase FAD-containing subunit
MSTNMNGLLRNSRDVCRRAVLCCAGTLSDFLFSEVLRLYPKLKPYAEVVLVQSAPHILPVFDGALQRQAEKNLQQLDVRILTGVRVCTSRPTSRVAAATGPQLQ